MYELHTNTSRFVVEICLLLLHFRSVSCYFSHSTRPGFFLARRYLCPCHVAPLFRFIIFTRATEFSIGISTKRYTHCNAVRLSDEQMKGAFTAVCPSILKYLKAADETRRTKVDGYICARMRRCEKFNRSGLQATQ